MALDFCQPFLQRLGFRGVAFFGEYPRQVGDCRDVVGIEPQRVTHGAFGGHQVIAPVIDDAERIGGIRESGVGLERRAGEVGATRSAC